MVDFCWDQITVVGRYSQSHGCYGDGICLGGWDLFILEQKWKEPKKYVI